MIKSSPNRCIQFQAAKLRKKFKPKTNEMRALWILMNGRKQTDWTFLCCLKALCGTLNYTSKVLSFMSLVSGYFVSY